MWQEITYVTWLMKADNELLLHGYFSAETLLLSRCHAVEIVN